MAAKTVKATINNQEVSLAYNEGTAHWEAKWNAPAESSHNLPGGYYPVSITAQDSAGNATTVTTQTEELGEQLKLYARERVKPTVQITSPSEGAYITSNAPKIEFLLLDNANGQETGFSGIDTGKTELTVGGKRIDASKISFSEVSGGQKGTYTPDEALSDGKTTITVTAYDFDENGSDPVSCTITIDTVAPILSVDSPADHFATNQSALVVSGTTNDATSSPVTIKIELNGVDQGEVEVQEDGSFNKEIQLAEQGENTVRVIATDKAGKTTEVSRIVEYNTVAPVISDVVITPNPVDCNGTFTISCKVV